MNIQKIINFLKMNKFEREVSICRNTYSFVHKNEFASIGKKSYFLKPLFLSGTEHIEMGEDVGVWHNARVEVLDRWNQQMFTPKLEIGNHVKIGQNLHLTCAQSVVIEKDALLAPRVMITDIDHLTADIALPVLEQNLVTNPVRICEGAFIGINATIMPGVTIGKHAVVGANAVVTKDVPDYATVAGSPAKIISVRCPQDRL